MNNKLAFSIKKYNSETRKTKFYDDVNKIFNEKILFKFNNFYVDFEMENELKIQSGINKFFKVYNKKTSSLSNQNFIITLSVLENNFFTNINLELFANKLYNILNDYLDILSFVVTKDSVDDITFYVICCATVKKVFLNHLVDKVLESCKNPNDLIGILSYNLILGGTVAEKPETKFINTIVNELNTAGYNLTVASEAEKQKYILDSYFRASNTIQNIYSDIHALFEHLINQNPRYKPYLKNVIQSNELDTLNKIIDEL